MARVSFADHNMQDMKDSEKPASAAAAAVNKASGVVKSVKPQTGAGDART